MPMSEYKPGTYTHRDGRTRLAGSPAEAVAAVFDGFVPQEAPAEQEEAPAQEQPKPRAPKQRRGQSDESNIDYAPTPETN